MLENMCQMTNLLFMLLCLASVYQKEAPSVAAVTQLYCFCKCLNRRCFLTEDFPEISSHHLSCSRRVHDHRTTRLKTHNFPRKSWPFHHLNQLRLVVDPIIDRVLHIPHGGWPWDFWAINSRCGDWTFENKYGILPSTVAQCCHHFMRGSTCLRYVGSLNIR